VAEVGDNAGEEVEELFGVLLLPVGELVDGRVPDQSGAPGLEDSGGAGVSKWSGSKASGVAAGTEAWQ